MSSVKSSNRYSLQPFRRAVLRGLGVILPPLLTIVILIWIASTVQQYVLKHVVTGARYTIVYFMNPTLTQIPEGVKVTVDAEVGSKAFRFEDDIYVLLDNGDWIPNYVREPVLVETGEPTPTTGEAYYRRYVDITYLTYWTVIPVFLAGFLIIMYLLGKFMAAGVGRLLWNSLEQVIRIVPIIRTVYSSVKQVTDFFFNEAEIQFTRVVAVEYPRRGIWSLGFVTGESMATIRAVAEEPVLSVLMPTSPIPGTGFTITVRKSETVDLDIPIDQALQFVVSCGVVLPNKEMREVNEKIASATADREITAQGS